MSTFRFTAYIPYKKSLKIDPTLKKPTAWKLNLNNNVCLSAESKKKMPLLIIISVSTVHVCLFDVNKPVCIRQRTQAYLFFFFYYNLTADE